MTTYDPALIERLVAEAREDDRCLGPAPLYVSAMADQLEAAKREVERTTACMKTAGLQCFMRNGTPEQIAAHMHSVAESWTKHDAKLTAERDALRAEVEKMRPVVDAAVPTRSMHEGCVTDPPCGACFRCEFDRAVDAYRATKDPNA